MIIHLSHFSIEALKNQWVSESLRSIGKQNGEQRTGVCQRDVQTIHWAEVGQEQNANQGFDSADTGTAKVQEEGVRRNDRCFENGVYPEKGVIASRQKDSTRAIVDVLAEVQFKQGQRAGLSFF